MDRESNSEEASLSDSWSTQSISSSSTKKRKSISNDCNAELELNLWSMLGEFNPDASFKTTQKVAKGVIDLFKEYYPFESRVSKPPKTSKLQHGKKTSSIKNPPKASSKPTTAPKVMAGPSNPIDATRTSRAPQSPVALEPLIDTDLDWEIDPLTNNEPSTSHKPLTSTESSTVINLSAKKSRPSSSAAKSDTRIRSVHDNKPTKMERELKRLATSEGYIAMYASAYKRVPKPIERFEVVQYEEERSRRSSRATSRAVSRVTSRGTSRAASRGTSRATSRGTSRATSRGTSRASSRRRSIESIDSDLADQPPNANVRIAEVTVHSVQQQQQQTVLRTTSTIGSYYLHERNIVDYSERIRNNFCQFSVSRNSDAGTSVTQTQIATSRQKSGK